MSRRNWFIAGSAFLGVSALSFSVLTISAFSFATIISALLASVVCLGAGISHRSRENHNPPPSTAAPGTEVSHDNNSNPHVINRHAHAHHLSIGQGVQGVQQPAQNSWWPLRSLWSVAQALHSNSTAHAQAQEPQNQGPVLRHS